MRIQPRRQLIETWRAVAQYSFPKQRWAWGGRAHRNSISDAEQLLCLLGPATQVEPFGIDLPDRTAQDIEQALAPLGDSVEIPQVLLRVIHDFLTTYADEGLPTFGGGSYFSTASGAEPTPEQRDLDVVDSFAVSVRLSLAVIGFAKVFRRVVQREGLLNDLAEVERLANQRLTASMVGLLRAFTINVIDADSEMDALLISTVNQGTLAPNKVRAALQVEFEGIKAGLRDITLGLSDVSGLENPHKLFECGWSWGVARSAPAVVTSVTDIRQATGFAQQAPYLYFTVVALDCIQHLFSERTRMLGLLDEEQSRLARALQVRFDLTLSYWSRLARFGNARWPLEDMPWKTTDDAQSDYLSLLVAAIVVLDFSNRPAPEGEPARVGAVLEELAERARITRRPVSRNDPAVSLHHPGFGFDLEGSEEIGGPRLRWELADFSTQLLKQTLRVAALVRTVEARGQLTELADDVWERHLLPRRIRDKQGTRDSQTSGLWDRPEAVYPDLPDSDERPSWYYTERVIGCLVSAAELIASRPLPSPELVERAAHLLAEADHLYDRELMRIGASGPSMRDSLQTADATLRRAHEMVDTLPGTAAALAAQVLADLDRISAARRDGSEVF